VNLRDRNLDKEELALDARRGAKERDEQGVKKLNCPTKGKGKRRRRISMRRMRFTLMVRAQKILDALRGTRDERERGTRKQKDGECDNLCGGESFFISPVGIWRGTEEKERRGLQLSGLRCCGLFEEKSAI